MNINLKKSVTLILGLVFCASFIFAEGLEKGKKKPAGRISGSPTISKLNINNISTFFSNTGYSDNAPSTDAGFQYPKGSGKTVFYVSGLLWGGNVNGNWRVGGTAYRIGNKGGRILPDGQPESEQLEHVRIYRVRPDYKNFTTPEEMGNLFLSETADEGLTAEAIYNQYDLDWKNWPAQYGAPFIDKDGNGVYNPDLDIPGMSEDPSQTIWAVANDLSEAATTWMYGALPMRIEQQMTVWAYKTTGALGNTLFRKYLVINKNTAAFDSMYLCMWSDPDLGGGFDDFAGVDTTLSLGFIYNAVAFDDVYKDTPPAAGFDFFQGPRIPGTPNDSAKFKNKWIKGWIGMGATSFFMFSQGQDANWSDPAQNQYNTGALYWRNLFQGKLARDGVPYTDPNTGRQTKWPMSGDPVTGTGWLDGQLFAKNDRRFGLVSGPFTMNPGDTQEVVVGQLAAGATPGVGNLAAVSILKFYDRAAQSAYDNSFQVPTPPPAPQVKVSELNDEIILSWLEPAAFTQTETFNKAGMKFEGYNIYQLPSVNSTIENAVRIVTYDVINAYSSILSSEVDPNAGVIITKVVAYGTNSGIKRSISITTDKLKGNIPLYNGSRYYFAVTAYGYNPDPNAVPNVLESPLTINTCTPQGIIPGTRINAATGDAVTALHSAGNSLATVNVDVLDPARLTGHAYEVSFSADQKWTVKDVTRGVNVLANQAVYSGTDANGNLVGNYTTNVDGLRINVAGSFYQNTIFDGIDLNGTPLTDVGDEWTSADGKWDIVDAQFFGYGGTSSYKSFGQGGGVGGQFGTELQDDFELRWTGVKGSQNIGGIDREYIVSGGSMATYYNVPEGLNNFPFNPAGTNANFLVRIPFEVWNTVTNQQITCTIRKREQGGAWQVWNASNGKRMYTDVVNIPYDPALILNADNKATWGPKLTWWFGSYMTDWTVGDVLKFRVPDNALTGADKFTFTAPAVTSGDAALAANDVNDVNVFPNPYYGANPQEINKYNRFVTFTHLPAKATIKIFNLAGQLIRTIQKDSPGQFQRWDIATDSGLPVPSGIFVAYIDMPDQGVVKKIKVAIIQEQQILDRF